MNQNEQFFLCPCCGSNMSILLDLSISDQTYIEDCEVCCRPLQINFKTNGTEIMDFFAQPSN